MGTRSSALALAQADSVAEPLRRLGRDVEIVPMKTEGDRLLGARLADVGGKGLFVREIEQALADGDDRRRRAQPQGSAGRAAGRAGAGCVPAARGRAGRAGHADRGRLRHAAGRRGPGNLEPSSPGVGPGPAGRTSRWSRSGATSIPACASSPRAPVMRSSWRPPGWPASAFGRRMPSPGARGVRAGGRAGDPRRRGAPRRSRDPAPGPGAGRPVHTGLRHRRARLPAPPGSLLHDADRRVRRARAARRDRPPAR